MIYENQRFNTGSMIAPRVPFPDDVLMFIHGLGDEAVSSSE